MTDPTPESGRELDAVDDACECGHLRSEHGPPNGISTNLVEYCRYCSTCAHFRPKLAVRADTEGADG